MRFCYYFGKYCYCAFINDFGHPPVSKMLSYISLNVYANGIQKWMCQCPLSRCCFNKTPTVNKLSYLKQSSTTPWKGRLYLNQPFHWENSKDVRAWQRTVFITDLYFIYLFIFCIKHSWMFFFPICISSLCGNLTESAREGITSRKHTHTHTYLCIYHCLS